MDEFHKGQSLGYHVHQRSCDICPNVKYVDDSTIFEILCSGNVISTIQQSIDDVVKWTDDNDTRLNIVTNAKK